MVQQLLVDELWGCQKMPAIVAVKSNWLPVFHSLTECNKTSFLLGRGKWRVSFLAVTGYFVKMKSPLKSHLQNIFPSLNDSSEYCMVEQASTYMNIDMARKHLLPKKACSMK